MNILALDCASKTGWAYKGPGQIVYGVQDFTKRRGESNGMVYLKLVGWLEKNFCDANVIYYEQPHQRGGGTSLLIGMVSHVESWATSHGIEFTAVHTGTLKKGTVGKGNASKDDMMDWFREQTGHDPQDDNEADAYALLRFAMDELGITHFTPNNHTAHI